MEKLDLGNHRMIRLTVAVIQLTVAKKAHKISVIHLTTATLAI